VKDGEGGEEAREETTKGSDRGGVSTRGQEMGILTVGHEGKTGREGVVDGRRMVAINRWEGRKMNHLGIKGTKPV